MPSIQTIAYAAAGVLKTIPPICVSSTAEAQFLDSAGTPLAIRIKPGILTGKTCVVRLRGQIAAAAAENATFRLYFGKGLIAAGTLVGSTVSAIGGAVSGNFEIAWTLQLNDATQFLTGMVQGYVAGVLVAAAAVTPLTTAALMTAGVAGSSGYVVAVGNPNAQVSTPASSTVNAEVNFVASAQLSVGNANNSVQLAEFSVETN